MEWMLQYKLYANPRNGKKYPNNYHFWGTSRSHVPGTSSTVEKEKNSRNGKKEEHNYRFWDTRMYRINLLKWCTTDTRLNYLSSSSSSRNKACTGTIEDGKMTDNQQKTAGRRKKKGEDEVANGNDLHSRVVAWWTTNGWCGGTINSLYNEREEQEEGPTRSWEPKDSVHRIMLTIDERRHYDPKRE